MQFFKLMQQAMVVLLIIFIIAITTQSDAAPKQKKKSKPKPKPKANAKTSNHHAKNINNKGTNKHATKKLKSLSTSATKSPVIQKYPKLSEFFSKRPLQFKGRTRLTQCEVTTKREQCLYRTSPKKSHCLLFQNIIDEVTPYYRPFISRSKLAGFALHEVKDLQINTCSRKVTLITKPQGNFTIFPKILDIQNVEGVISLPIPFGDFQLLAGGEWIQNGLTMKVKFTREHADTYSIKGYSVKELVSVQTIAEIFDTYLLPSGPTRKLLQNFGIDKMKMRDCRMYGTFHPQRNVYEVAFSGEPEKDEYMGGRIRVFITSYQSKRNLAVLLELQEFSPVTLLKSIYGPGISKASVLRDRNQTIALYVSPNPTSRFSSTLTTHGSGRWIHRDSIFDPGAYLLVTLPFPQRKAVDMKVKLQENWLEFSIPENEKLYSDLALSAILPEKIMHLGVDKSAEIKNKDNKMYSKIRILHFKYFISNNTYLAAAESHLSMEEELAEYMPSPIQMQQQKAFPSKQTPRNDSVKIKTNTQFQVTRNKQTATKAGPSLEAFFSNEPNGENGKITNHEIKPLRGDTLTLAQATGLL